MWQRIIEWFNDKYEKNQLVSEFNRSAALAWDKGDFPVFLKAKVVLGNSRFKHSNSDFFSGFRIKVVSMKIIDKEACKMIGLVIYSDQKLVRKLIRCGFDTLEVFGSNSNEDGYEIGLTQFLLDM
jgi:hypothetical protein